MPSSYASRMAGGVACRGVGAGAVSMSWISGSRTSKVLPRPADPCSLLLTETAVSRHQVVAGRPGIAAAPVSIDHMTVCHATRSLVLRRVAVIVAGSTLGMAAVRVRATRVRGGWRRLKGDEKCGKEKSASEHILIRLGST
jgi:hypothetical protein